MSANENKREDKYILLGSICCDRKEIECKTQTGRTQFIMALAEHAKAQFKENRVEIRSVRILDTTICSGSLVWLFSPAWDTVTVQLTLPGG